MKTKKKTTYRSLDELLARESVEFTPLEKMRKNFRKIAADSDRRFGPLVSLRRGRPRKGEKPTGTVPKTVKHTPGFWETMAAKAKARGLTLHEAMRQALGEWVNAR
jgi:hypothetical protein